MQRTIRVMIPYIRRLVSFEKSVSAIMYDAKAIINVAGVEIELALTCSFFFFSYDSISLFSSDRIKPKSHPLHLISFTKLSLSLR